MTTCHFLQVAAGIVLTSIAAAPSVAAADDRPAIVVLYVDDSSQSWIREISDGIADVAYRRAADSPVLYFEYLDAIRFSDSGATARMRAALKNKYRDRRIDLVVAVAPDAVSFVEQARDELWPDLPVLFTSYTGAIPDRVAALPHAAGLTFEWGYGQSLAALKAFLPDLTTIAVVAGTAPIERQRQARDIAEIQRQGLAAMNLAGQSLSDTLKTVSRLPAHTVVTIAGGQVDGSGHLVPTWPLCEMISNAASVPTVMLGSQFLGCGIVGGLMRDYRKIGAVIADRAIAGLSGRIGGNETVPFQRFASLKFDERQLARWRIDEAKLPPGSVVEFRQPGLWRDYRNEIVIGATALVLQSVLIVSLLYERRHRRRAEAESRRNLAMAAHADRRAAITTLTGSIAHELSQPLGSILHNADAAARLVASQRATPQELQEILNDIRREDTRATQIVQRHRTMLKSREVDSRPLDLYAAIREALALVAHDADARDVRIDAQLPAGLCLVEGDQVLLQQVVVNLAMNAIDAMAHTPLSRRRIVVGSMARPGGVTISVRDSGAGIASEIDGHVFEPFVTTKPNGLGIGLSIVRNIVEAHGGTIEARNVDDGGAVFRFTLPCIPAAGEQVAWSA